MKNTLETVLSFAGMVAFGGLCGYLFGKERGLSEGGEKGFEVGRKVGAKAREKEILDEYVCYVPVGEVEAFVQTMLEEMDVSEDYPLLVVRAEKYDFEQGVEFED